MKHYLLMEYWWRLILVKAIDKFPESGKGNKEGELMRIERLWDIFSKNGEAIEQDFARLTKGKKSAKGIFYQYTDRQ